MVNLSLQKGVFLKPLKNAIVTPLIKKTSLSKEDLKNYWLVSGLSFLSKLMEHIVSAQIRSHIASNYLGNTFKSVYKAGHSMETALLCIQNEIHLSLFKGTLFKCKLNPKKTEFIVFGSMGMISIYGFRFVTPLPCHSV